MKCACPANAPRLQHRVTIEKPNESSTKTAGGHLDLSNPANWTVVGKRWASIATRGGTERWRFNQVSAEVDRIFQLPYDSLTRTIQPRWRIKFSDGPTTIVSDIAASFDIDAAKRVIEVHGTQVVE